MEANNADNLLNETTETLDTSDGIPEVSAVEAGETAPTEVDANAETDVNTGEESTSQPETDENTVYQIADKEYTLEQLEDLEKGNMLQADYTKKRQVDAEKSKALDADIAKVGELKSNLSETIAKLEESITVDTDVEEMEYLRQNDTGEYLKRKEEAASKKEMADKAKTDLQKLQEAEDLVTLQKEQQLLADAMPTWVDPKQREADVTMVQEYVKQTEFPDDDFQKLTSHKLMIMAMDAARYHQLKAKTAETEKAVQKAPNVVKASVKQKTSSKPKSATELFYGS